MADTLVLHLSEDAWNGDAQFTVDVDGVQIAGPTSVTTVHGSGFQDFTYSGDFGARPHTVAVHFLNDAWGGSSASDRNLYVGGIDFNGHAYAGEAAQNDAMAGQPNADPNAAEMYVNGTVTFAGVTGTIFGTEGDDTLIGTSGDEIIDGLGGNDTIDGRGGNDTLIGGPGNDLIFGAGNSTLLGGDGNDVIYTGTGNDTADGGNGDDFIRMSGHDGTHVVTGGAGLDHFDYLAANPPGHAVSTITDFVPGEGGEFVQFFDMYTEFDVGPYRFDAIYTRMTDLPDGSTRLSNPDGSTLTFEHASRDDFTTNNFFAASTGHPPPGSDPVDTLVLHLSEDAWNGDAKFRLLVDGHEMTGALAVTTAHGSGFQDFTYTGRFGTNPHTVEIKFVNDAWGGAANADRNLYVGGIDYNGQLFAGQTAQNTAMGGGPDSDPNAAEMYSNGSVIFTNVGSSRPPPPPGSSTVVLHVSEDAWNGDAQFILTVDNVQFGALRTVTASHGLGQVQDITITGNFGTEGPGTIGISFVNDAWGGSASADRNLYVQSIDVNGVHFQGNTALNNAANGAEATDPTAAVMAVNGVAEFHIDHSAPPQIMG